MVDFIYSTSKSIEVSSIDGLGGRTTGASSSSPKLNIDEKDVAELTDLRGLAWDGRLAASVEHANHIALQSGRPATLAAAHLATTTHSVRSHAEPLA